jgi:sulfatase maturation enzyme AslB (radical SAM superfamily)
MIATNASILPNDELKDLLESCGTVSFKVSLDGVGIVNDWIRWPSKFDQIEHNINVIEEWWQERDNINLEFHTVVGAYNLFFLEQIIHYVKKRSAWTHSWNWIRHPEWQAINVLPNKYEVIRELELLKNQYVFMDTNPFGVSIDRLHDSTILGWNDFVFENQRLEKERNMCSPISKLL